MAYGKMNASAKGVALVSPLRVKKYSWYNPGEELLEYLMELILFLLQFYPIQHVTVSLLLTYLNDTSTKINTHIYLVRNNMEDTS